MTKDGLVTVPERHSYPGAGFWEKIRLTAIDAWRDTLRTFSGLVKSEGFHRLIIFLLMIGLLKVVFNAMDYVLPPFAIRELGEGARVGLGLLGEYIGRIYQQIRNRPRYVVQTVLEKK